MKNVGQYKVLNFTKRRQMIAELLDQNARYKHIIGILENDVTKAMDIITKHRERTGERLSFTSWAMKCIAQAVSEFPELITFRKGRRKLIQFEDVDIKCVVEKVVEGVKHPIAYVIRSAQTKSFREIHEEIRLAQSNDDDKRENEEKIKKNQLTIMKFPKFIRRLIWHFVMTNPLNVKKHIGTCGVTSMGMFGKGITGWAIPKTAHATTFALGAIVKKPVYIDDKLEPREILHLTAEFDHDIVDGGPAVRFCARLKDLMGEAYGLEDYM
ncbi:MAG: 2-oxo acid dehydrogenase subunit E2 [Candidatus Heimdallarchaeota archaeon]|nr:2-oxo acid dehydrogenase subunit E2 [Candidatus Heimdallarchaeota archaeon]